MHQYLELIMNHVQYKLIKLISIFHFVAHCFLVQLMNYPVDFCYSFVVVVFPLNTQFPNIIHQLLLYFETLQLIIFITTVECFVIILENHVQRLIVYQDLQNSINKVRIAFIDQSNLLFIAHLPILQLNYFLK